MSYYSNPFKYVMTNHAIRRAKERLNMRDLSNFEIQRIIEEYLEYSIFYGHQNNGCILMVNPIQNVTFVLDKSKRIIMTIY